MVPDDDIVPGQGGAAWSPAYPTSSGRVTAASWWDASRISALSDGDAVGTWSDLIGGNHVSQDTASLKPTYKTGVKNGLPVVRFTDDRLNSYSGPSIDLDALTLFLVAVDTASTRFDGLFVMPPAPPSTDYYRFMLSLDYNGSAEALNVAVAYGGGGGQIVYGTVRLPWSLITVRSEAPTFVLRTNGVQRGTKTGSGSWPTVSNGIGIGCRYEAGNWGRPMNGDIAEIVLYSAALSATDVSQVESYLNAKWAIY